MTRAPVTVRPGTPVRDIAQILIEHGISAVPVAQHGTIVGIVSEADLLAKPAYGPGRRGPIRLALQYFSGRDPGWLHRASGIVAADIMTPHVERIAADEDVEDAARRMLGRGVKRLLVVDGDQVTGIVSRQDLLPWLASRALDEPA